MWGDARLRQRRLRLTGLCASAGKDVRPCDGLPGKGDAGHHDTGRRTCLHERACGPHNGRRDDHMNPIKGSIVALVTPFHEDGSVNFEKLKELLDWHIAHGTDGILVLGTTGESSTMSHEEDDAVARLTIEHVAHRLPVIVGA